MIANPLQTLNSVRFYCQNKRRCVRSKKPLTSFAINDIFGVYKFWKCVTNDSFLHLQEAPSQLPKVCFNSRLILHSKLDPRLFCSRNWFKFFSAHNYFSTNLTSPFSDFEIYATRTEPRGKSSTTACVPGIERKICQNSYGHDIIGVRRDGKTDKMYVFLSAAVVRV